MDLFQEHEALFREEERKLVARLMDEPQRRPVIPWIIVLLLALVLVLVR